MLPHAQQAVSHAFRAPRPRKPRTVEKCAPCRDSKRSCSYSDHNTWPNSKCRSCSDKGLRCSKPGLAGQPKQLDMNGRLPTDTSSTPSQLHKPIMSSEQHIYVTDTSSLLDLRTDPACQQAILLLSLHAVLLMAIQELINLTTSMVRPYQRHQQRENKEDNIPELSRAVEELKKVAKLVNFKMLETARTVKDTTTFSIAQNALTTHYFRRDLSWGTDHTSVAECQSAITQFQQRGHTSLAYILQVRLLQDAVVLPDAELENMASSRSKFVAEADSFFRSIPPHLADCQMFTPREVVRNGNPIFRQAILADGRPDYLRRSTIQIMFDAGISPDLWSADHIHHADILGRTVLHQAVHRRDITTVEELFKLRANLEQCCLNKQTALHIAACQGQSKIVNFLLNRAPGLLERQDSAGRTAFWCAARSSQLGVVKLLGLRCDVNIDHQDSGRHSAIAIAARDGRFGVLNSLLQLRTEKGKLAYSAHTSEGHVDHLPLLLASRANQPDCVRLILKYRSWTAGDAEYCRLLDLAKQWQDTKLALIVQESLISDIKDKLADATASLLEPPAKQATDKAPSPPKVPYESGPLAWQSMPCATLAEAQAGFI